MGIAKVILNGVTQMDLTSDTVVADKLMQDYTAHGADGNLITGTATVEPITITTNGVYTASAGTAYSPVTVSVSGGGGGGTHTATIVQNGCSQSAYVYAPSSTSTTFGESIWQVGSSFSFSSGDTIGVVLKDAQIAYAYVNANAVSQRTISYDYTFTYDYVMPDNDVYFKMLYTLGQSSAHFNIITDVTQDKFNGILQKKYIGYIEDDATYIGDYAFISDLTVTSASFANVSQMGTAVFRSCSSLSSIYFPKVSIIGNYAFADTAISGAVELLSAYSIGNFAFDHCSLITEMSLPVLTYLSSSAFRTCTGISKIYAPNLYNIGAYVFFGCTSLTQVDFPSAKFIANSAFSSCTGLSFASLPEITDIPTGLFNGCTVLKSVYMPKVVTIGSVAFWNCYSLESASFPSVTAIYTSYAFGNCSALSTAYFPSVNNIPSATFNSCINLVSVIAPNITYIGSYAFAYCSALPSASYSKVATVNQYAFQGCHNLSVCCFDSTKTNLSNAAFSSCYNLMSLYMLGTQLGTLQNISVFYSTPISNYTESTGGVYGSIFVRESLYSQYIVSTNWVTYSDRIVSLTDAQVQNVLTYGKHDP